MAGAQPRVGALRSPEHFLLGWGRQWPCGVHLDWSLFGFKPYARVQPLLEWCVGNVVGRPDRRGNLYPAKPRPEQKIDAAVALMMAVGRAMAEDAGEGDPEDFLRDPVIA